jgi:hypothetical protein
MVDLSFEPRGNRMHRYGEGESPREYRKKWPHDYSAQIDEPEGGEAES